MFQSLKWIFVIGSGQLSTFLRHISKAKQLWQRWNLRSFILFSIVVQFFFLFAAPLRKKTANKAIIMIIWAAYLIADWAASFAVGLVFDSEEKYTASDAINNTASYLVMMNHGLFSTIRSRSRDDTGLLLVMWTPFLLLLVGGQDRITSFAIEDNELWLRHLIWLFLQILTTGFVFYQSFHLNTLWIPTIFLLLAGTIKYAERIAALYFASSDSVGNSVLREPNPEPNYEILMSEYGHYKGNNLPAKIDYVIELESQANEYNDRITLDSHELVQSAHYFAFIYKGLIVNQMLSSRERTESREFFTKRSAEETLKILEIQLNYFYDLLHSKVVVATSQIGRITRGMCTVLVVSAFSLFHIEEKRTFQPFDVSVTYALFGAVFGLDMATLLIWFYSDWTVASLKNFDKESRRFKINEMLLFPKKEMREQPRSKDSLLFKFINKLLFPRKKTQEQSDKDSLRFKIMQLLFPKKQTREQPRGPGSVFSRRWSENLSQFNFLYYCCPPRPSRSDHIRESGCLKVYSILRQLKEIVEYFIYFIHLIINYLFYYLFYFYFPRVVQNFIDQKKRDLIIQLNFVRSYHFDPRLWEFIFNELKEKSDFADDQEEAKRISSARGEWILENSDFFDYSISSELMSYVKIVAYDESLLLWHIATELCYNTDPHSNVHPPLDCKYCKACCSKKCRMVVEFWKKDDLHSRLPSGCEQCDAREFSKRLSDYMMYLLHQQPNLMSEVSGIAKQRFRDTSAEVRRFFSQHGWGQLAVDYEKIIEVHTRFKSAHVKGNISKSALSDASTLAKELKKLGPQKWKVMSKVWVELLSYAASRSKGKVHVQQLSKGGELLTFVWLLMAQFGLREFWDETRIRPMLTVYK